MWSLFILLSELEGLLLPKEERVHSEGQQSVSPTPTRKWPWISLNTIVPVCKSANGLQPRPSD